MLNRFMLQPIDTYVTALDQIPDVKTRKQVQFMFESVIWRNRNITYFLLQMESATRSGMGLDANGCYRPMHLDAVVVRVYCYDRLLKCIGHFDYDSHTAATHVQCPSADMVSTTRDVWGFISWLQDVSPSAQSVWNYIASHLNVSNDSWSIEFRNKEWLITPKDNYLLLEYQGRYMRLNGFYNTQGKFMLKTISL